ncbi:MAG: hypothetical protein M3Z25_01970 [Actinomycetota bacterium]|nr:hypothetical protein [Actinomycetota bacterium]
MQQLFYGLAALACPVGMGLMMWMMMRSQRGETGSGASPAAGGGEDRAGQIDALRAEIDQLKAERAGRPSGGQ